MIQFIVSIILYFVIFFGISFILNMLLRRTWLMTLFYPIVIAVVVTNNKLVDYFIEPKNAFTKVYDTMTSLAIADLVILSAGLIGTIASGFTIKYLRKSGYQMF